MAHLADGSADGGLIPSGADMGGGVGAPTLRLPSASDTGWSNTDQVTKANSPVLVGEAAAGATVTIYDGATMVGSTTADGSGNWSMATSLLADGAHSLTAIATLGGVSSTASTVVTVTVDATAPTLSISPSASTLKAGETAAINFTFSEPPGGTFTLADVTVSGGTLSALSGGGSSYSATFTPTANVNSGTASISVVSASYTDQAGNGGGAGSMALSYDTRPPILAITSNMPSLKAGESATITFTFSEDPGASFGWDGSSGDLAVSGGTLSAVSGSGASRTATFTPSANVDSGMASISVQAGTFTDAAGNSNSASASLSFGFDTQRPSAPTSARIAAGSDSGASDSDNVTRLTTVDVVGQAQAGAGVRLYDGDGTLLGNATANGSGAWLIGGLNLAAGSSTLQARAVDGAGNESTSYNFAITVDTTRPTLATSTVNGSSLVLTYSEPLDASHPPAASAFAVQVGGASATVTAVALDSAAKTVTLTLGAPVSAGQAVTVAYADPTAGDDANAIQDLAGNDAASLPATAAVNNTAPATPDPQPEPEPDPPAQPPAPPIPVGTPTADILVGGESPDTIRGGDGDDQVAGGAGADMLDGENGDDFLHGNMGADTLMGGAGDDIVRGGKDSDWVQGNAGADLLFGDIGDDTVRGGQGDDVLEGGTGDDFLSGDRGSDTLTGGAGADTFHSFGEAGLDLITDFNAAEGDRLQLAPGTTFTLSQEGADAVVSLGGGAKVILAGVQLSSLPDGWLI